jgi:hypothetical protein
LHNPYLSLLEVSLPSSSFTRRASSPARPRWSINCFESSFSLYVSDEHRTADYLLGFLDVVPEGTTELITHPGTEGWRDKERCALLDSRVKTRIEELDIELITYGSL